LTRLPEAFTIEYTAPKPFQNRVIGTPARGKPMIGQTVSHYKITEKLGEGGMGVVYKAEDTTLDREVAIKFLPPHLKSDKEAKKRFLHEAKAASALNHSNIAVVHEIDETSDGRMFIVMAYYDGQTLKDTLEGGPLPVDQVVDIVSQVASGLAKAHEKDILHRDIKPANILITKDGEAKLADFGLAKLAGQTKLTKTGTTVGTVHYMSPEQASGGEVHAGSDIFSLGVVLYELLTGEVPFNADHEAAVIYSIMNQDPNLLDTYRGDLHEGLQRVIDKALTKESDERYSSAVDLLADLKKVQKGRQVAALERRTKRKIRSRTLLYTAIGLVIVAAGYAGLSRFVDSRQTQQSENTGAISPNVVAVLPFAVRGDEEFADLSEGMVDLLSTHLDGAGTLRSVDPRALLGLVRREGGGALDPERAREIAVHFGAGLYLVGDIMAVGGELHINVSLYGSSESAGTVAQAIAKGQTTELLAIVEDLAAQLLKDRLGEANEIPHGLGSITTESYPALKAYLAGEREARAFRHEQAREAFQRAVDEDSTFALAGYRLAKIQASQWYDTEQAKKTMKQVRRHSEGLSERDRRHVEAFDTILKGDAKTAETLYRTIVGVYPDDAEAWFQLGQLQLFNNWRWGRPAIESRAAFERAVALDPERKQTDFYLGWTDAMGSQEEAKAEPQKEQQNLGLALFGAVVRADEAAQGEIIDKLKTAGEFAIINAVYTVSSYTDNLPVAQQVAWFLTAPTRSPETRGLGHIFLAHLECAQGRWGAAKEQFVLAEALVPAMAIEYRALLAAMPLLAVPTAEIEAIRDGLIDWDADDVQPSESPIFQLTVHNDLHPLLRTYLLGLMSARLGDAVTALDYASRLEQMSRPSDVTDLAGDLSYGLRAQVAWKEGRRAQALAEFERAQMKAPTELIFNSPFYFQSYERYLRAELLHELGRDEEALGWYGSFTWVFSYEFIYPAPSCLRRAQICEQLGRQEEAAEYYSRFIELWKDCDEELRPLVIDAEAKLRNLNK